MMQLTHNAIQVVVVEVAVAKYLLTILRMSLDIASHN